jgi:hypothetical protein
MNGVRRRAQAMVECFDVRTAVDDSVLDFEEFRR